MIYARLTFTGANASRVAEALVPDNLPDIKLEAEGTTLRVEFASAKPGTVLSTSDDILMNIKIAEEALASLEDP